MKKVKLSDVLARIPAINELAVVKGLNALQNSHLMKVLRLLEEETKDFNAARAKSITEHTKKGEDGSETLDTAALEADLKPLLEEEIELPYIPIKVPGHATGFTPANQANLEEVGLISVEGD